MDRGDFLTATRAGYDRTAALYAQRFHRHLDNKPLDRAMLNAFAALVAMTQNRHVLDVGCGTGATTAILRDHGLEAVGIDVSPNMIAQAQRLNPDLSFRVGSCRNSTCPNTASAVCARGTPSFTSQTSISARSSKAFSRVLVPGGLVLLAFQVGDQPRILREAFGQHVELTFYRRRPGDVTDRLERAGLHRYAEVVREPDSDGFESTQHAYLIARKHCPKL